jgi:predicted RNA-binding Zn-ribbon protein involved in translation (DUF1610 family)
MVASVAATTQAMTLAQSGIAKALIVTSQPRTTRNNWSSATSENTTTARVVKAFSLLFDIRRDVAELMAECPMCGAITMLPIEIAWRQGVVYCCECGAGMSVTRAVLERLQGQADGASATIKRLLHP